MTIRFATSQDMDAIMALRFEVFVDEQGTPPEEEFDEQDLTSRHVVAEEDGTVIGCARIIKHSDSVQIGRLAVRRSCRGRGIGRDICLFIIEDTCARGYTYIWLNGQTQARPFYEKLGFRAVGEVFFEVGIEHLRMDLRLS